MGKQRDNIWYNQRYILKQKKYARSPQELSAYYENWKYAAMYARKHQLTRVLDFGCGPALHCTRI